MTIRTMIEGLTRFLRWPRRGAAFDELGCQFGAPSYRVSVRLVQAVICIIDEVLKGEEGRASK